MAGGLQAFTHGNLHRPEVVPLMASIFNTESHGGNQFALAQRLT